MKIIINFIKAFCFLGLIVLAFDTVQPGFYSTIDKWYIFGISALTVFIIGYEFANDKSK